MPPGALSLCLGTITQLLWARFFVSNMGIIFGSAGGLPACGTAGSARVLSGVTWAQG